MTTHPFIWHDLMTTDIEAARRFYGAVAGWRIAESGIPGSGYLVLHAGDDPVGGIMAIPPGDDAMPPCWTGYVGVADVDAKAGQVAALGGAIVKAPQDIAGVGRFAVVADPQGAVFILFRGNSPEGPPARPMGTPGHFAWAELHADEATSAFAFYRAMFGWTPGVAHDMGGFVYQTFSTGGDGEAGGMMTKMEGTPGPFWSYYVWVGDIDAAVARVTAEGGTVLMAPHEVPGGAFIANCQDPQGAMFNLLGQRQG